MIRFVKPNTTTRYADLQPGDVFEFTNPGSHLSTSPQLKTVYARLNLKNFDSYSNARQSMLVRKLGRLELEKDD